MAFLVCIPVQQGLLNIFDKSKWQYFSEIAYKILKWTTTTREKQAPNHGYANRLTVNIEVYL